MSGQRRGLTSVDDVASVRANAASRSAVAYAAALTPLSDGTATSGGLVGRRSRGGSRGVGVASAG